MQYRETDFNFLSRTLEKYGVFYYFTFEDGKHTLVLDMKKNYPACEEAEVIYRERQRPAADRRPHHQLAARLRIRAGQVVAHRLQLRDPLDVPQHERAQAAVGGPPASRQVRGLRLPRWIRRQIGGRDRRAYPAGRERSAAQPRGWGQHVPHLHRGPQVHADESSRCGCGVRAGQVLPVDVGGALGQPVER